MLLAAEGTDRWLESAEERDLEDGGCHWGLVLVLEETGLWGSQKARPRRQVTAPAAACPGPRREWVWSFFDLCQGVCF